MKVKVYEMEMEFEVVVGLKDINDFMHNMGFVETMGASGYVMTIKQTLLFIPNEEYIRTIEKTIKDHYETKSLNILECHFRGYKKFLEKEVEVDSDEENEAK